MDFRGEVWWTMRGIPRLWDASRLSWKAAGGWQDVLLGEMGLRYTKVLGYRLADNRKCCFIESNGLLIKSL